MSSNRRKPVDRLNLALVGCGEITETVHLPVSVLSDGVSVTVLVDKVLARARQLADRYGVPAAVDDYRSTLGQIDAAIVALPHHLHAPVTLDLLQHGIHVLVEKPMALTTDDCDKMDQAASNAEAILAVGLIRRFYESSRFVKRTIERGILGDIVSVDFREGVAYEGIVASDFRLRRETGGGVLIDMGTHVLDLLLWWLGECDSLEYRHDAMGGVEANCRLDLRFRSGATGIVELSWNRNLRNSSIVSGERAVLEVGTGYDSPLCLRIKNEDVSLFGRAIESSSRRTILDVFRSQLDDFVDAVRNRRAPFVPAQEGKRAVSLIEACYAARQPSNQPWLYPEQLTMERLDSASAD